MAHYQSQSIFFRLPQELRVQVYQYCQELYMAERKTVFHRSCTEFDTMLKYRFTDIPALLMSCKRIKEEAEPWMHRHIDFEFSDNTGMDIVVMYNRAVGKIDLQWVRLLTLNFEDLVVKPTLTLSMMEHIVDHAPRLRALEIAWDDMVFYPLAKIISLEENIEPWFLIWAKAKGLKRLKLKGVTKEWAEAAEKELERQNKGVKLEIELYKPKVWAKMM
ncbi:hypothetical protein F4677DRAFT_347520 [Hypoxylon crocopeplum]|nr:hypothetical protein F4677DRAFT_347520 [Hypoxylon crocopeplum]